MSGVLHAQVDFKIADRTVQVHSFFTHGFMYSGGNNYLSAPTRSGTFALTDGGANISTQITDKFRVGAQVYFFNVGELGNWRPALDWAMADYRFKDWLGIRAGKVKTVFGLYTDTQDMTFLHTFALLPQAIYSIDTRDQSIAHTGGDLYGNVSLKKLGSLAYTGFVGNMWDSQHSGHIYSLQPAGIHPTSFGGLSAGADLRWNAPVNGLVLGASYMRQHPNGDGTCVPTGLACHGDTLYTDRAVKAFTQQFYTQYTYRKFRLDGEYRRVWHSLVLNHRPTTLTVGSKGFYGAAAYRVSPRLELGTYFSQVRILTSFDLPAHIFDKAVAARVDLSKNWNVKVEGHFMNGTGPRSEPWGFYPTVNRLGFKDKTPMLVVRSGWNF